MTLTDKILIFAGLLFAACSGRNNQPQPAAASLPLLQTDGVEVVRLDTSGTELLRVFVAISAEKVQDTTFIRQVFCLLKQHYPIGEQTGISFFSDKKYADYKDNLFFKTDSPLPESEYDNWLNSCYLGEIDCKTMQYATYPASNVPKQQRTYILGACDL